MQARLVRPLDGGRPVEELVEVAPPDRPARRRGEDQRGRIVADVVGQVLANCRKDDGRNADGPAFQVDILPLQRCDLASPQAGERGHEDQSAVPVRHGIRARPGRG